MSWTQDSLGPTTTDGTLQTLATPTTNASYVFRIDTTNMVNGDEIVITVLSKTLTGSSALGQQIARYIHAQDSNEVIKELGPFTMHFGGTFKLQRVAGSDHAYDWSLERI